MSKIETKQITLVSENGLVEKTLSIDNSGNTQLPFPTFVGGYNVVESGSNANGYWVKFYDGTMMQYGSGFTSASISANVEADISRPFPLPFLVVSSSHVGIWATASWAGVFVKGQDQDLTQCVTRVANGATAQTFKVNFLAIGRWR